MICSSDCDIPELFLIMFSSKTMIEKLIKGTRYHINNRICWFFLFFV